jgi:hypothetical protein
MDVQESRFVEPGNLRTVDVAELWVAAVPGRVGGFIERGPCGLSGGRRVGGGSLGLSVDFCPGLVVGLGGNGRFGG